MKRTLQITNQWGKPASLAALAFLAFSPVYAQRMQQELGRGVVAVQNGSSVTVTWRRLAQEPEDARYNIYIRKAGAADYTKLNAQPLSNTNYKTTTSNIPVGADVAVSIVTDEGEGAVEHGLSRPFTMKSYDIRNMYMSILFNNSPLDNKDFDTKFCWPVDLDGNGEYDYVVDRNSVNSDRHYLEAYLADGTYLWTVDLGPNEWSSTGQDDQICAYDIDCDGKGEVIVQTSDGSRFWDKEKGTWGLYANGSETADTDGDGIVDYNAQTSRNAPKYFSVIDGLTGAEKACVEQAYDEAYNRTNKASLMGDEYNKHVGHVGIFYPDGIHPALVMEWHTRTTSGAHQYRNSAFSYDFSSGSATNWHQLFMEKTGGATFHQIRILDADGDGRDEMSSGAYCMDHDGSTLYNSGISHGDRHRTSDIDPERPGLETFSIQQDAPDMLGQILFDAATGEPIKKWYLSAVGDVGRGECIDIDKTHLGWEMWSTMDGVYSAKGDRIDGLTNTYPTEGIWWDNELDREIVQSSDSHYNVYVQDYFNGRLIEIAKLSGYRYITSYGKRAKFWGDIVGDWREELVLNHMEDGVNVGIVGFSTDYTTAANNIYCLQQDPHYRGDCTTKGYYQSPNTGFYLGYDMPRPQLPPCMVTDLVAKSGGQWTTFDRVTAAPYADGKTLLLDLTLGDEKVELADGSCPGTIYAMPVKGQTVTLAANMGGEADIWKSQQGTLVLEGKCGSKGKVIVSEGTLQVDGTVEGLIDLRARGTLAGSGTVGGVVLEGAMNYEGGCIMPSATLTIKNDFLINKKTYIETDIDKVCVVKVEGNLSLSAPLVLTINSANPQPGEYKIVEYGGEWTGDLAKVSVRGLVGIATAVEIHDNALWLVIKAQRDAAQGVKWTGTESTSWDYDTPNFALDGESTTFVAQDGLYFGDEAKTKTVKVSELMPVARVEFDTESTYTLTGDGGISGEGMLVKNGNGKLVLNAVKSDYTGATVINAGTVSVKDLADGGLPSSLGAASSDAANLRIGKATLLINNTNAATNRGITLTDTATISIASGTVALKGIIKGDGTLLKSGAGQVNITYTSANSWASTILQGGTLAMGTWNTTFGKPTSTIHVTGNSTLAMFDCNSSSTIPSVQNAIDIDKGKKLTFRAGSRCKVQGSLLGQGTYSISFPYVRGDVYTNCSKFEGVYEVASGQWRLRQAVDLSKATLQLGAGVYAAGYSSDKNEGSYTHKIGSLTSTASDCTLSTGVWNVGYLSEDGTYAGTFNASATLNKYGEGRLTLTGASAGKLNVYAGAVEAKTSKAPVTSGSITVRDGGTLEGSGMVGSVTVNKGGTLGAGKGTSIVLGTLTVDGSLTMSAGAVLRVRTRSTATNTLSDAFVVNGAVKLTDPVIDITNLTDNYPIVDNATITIFKGDGEITLNGEPTITPAVPKAGWLWDTSRLASDGIISVVPDPVGVGSVSAEGLSDGSGIYDLNGRPAKGVSGDGVYIIRGEKRRVGK